MICCIGKEFNYLLAFEWALRKHASSLNQNSLSESATSWASTSLPIKALLKSVGLGLCVEPGQQRIG